MAAQGDERRQSPRRWRDDNNAGIVRWVIGTA
jgi:hypothetical protein